MPVPRHTYPDFSNINEEEALCDGVYEKNGECFPKNMAGVEYWKDFVRKVKSGEILCFCWDSDIPFDEFARQLEAGVYDDR